MPYNRINNLALDQDFEKNFAEPHTSRNKSPQINLISNIDRDTTQPEHLINQISNKTRTLSTRITYFSIENEPFKYQILKVIIDNFIRPTAQLIKENENENDLIQSNITGDDFKKLALHYTDQLISTAYCNSIRPFTVNQLQKIIMESDWKSKLGVVQIIKQLLKALFPELQVILPDGEIVRLYLIDNPNNY